MRRNTVHTLVMCVAAVAATVSGSVVYAQPATLAGKVVADSTERPLANAIIGLTDVGVSTRSDSAGNFVLGGIKPGRHIVSVRLVGYEPIRATVTFAASEKVEGDFVLRKATTTLETVEVKAKTVPPTVRELEFEEHRQGPGRFLTADVFAESGGRSVTDILLSKLSGLRLIRTSDGKQLLASTRGGSFNRDCYYQVVLNNLIMTTNGPFDVGTILSTDVIGVEFYSVANTPLRYGGTQAGSQCGTIVIWTKS